MTKTRRFAFSGTSPSAWLTLDQTLWRGIAPSRAKLQVAREAAQQMEMAQNTPIPKTE